MDGSNMKMKLWWVQVVRKGFVVEIVIVVEMEFLVEVQSNKMLDRNNIPFHYFRNEVVEEGKDFEGWVVQGNLLAMLRR